MKPLAILLVVFFSSLCAAGAAVLAVSVTRAAPEPLGAVPGPAPAGPGPASPGAGSEASGAAVLAAQLDRLTGRLAALEDQVLRLREDSARQPAPAADQDPLAARLEVTPDQREVIVGVVAEVRAAEEAERAEQRLQREEDEILRRAERIAGEIGLSAPDQKALADHLSVAAVKRRELMELARAGGADRTTLREDFMALRDWSEQSLRDSFGADLARQIQEVDRSSRFGRERAGFGPEGGGGGGNTGGGGRGRRGN